MTVDTDLSAWSARIEYALSGRGLRTVYQPIIDLQRRTAAGYEALTRFDDADGLNFNAEEWFAAAAALGATAELDARSLQSALQARPDLPRNCFLSVNVDPASLIDRQVMDLLQAQGNLSGMVIEITEHRRWDWSRLAPAVERLRSAGAIFAVDDAGAGYSGLRQILQLRPAILKLDRSIVQGVDRDEAKRALIEMLGIFANRIDAWILAEGVETPSEAQALLDLEVPLAQGFYFANPGYSWPTITPIALTELRQIPQARGNTLHRLVDPLSPISDAAQPGAELVHRNVEWAAVVDDDRRPLGLVNSEAAASGILAKSLVANVHSSPQEVGQRIATSTAGEPCAPVIVVDNGGRYVGLVSIRRLIRALSADSPPS